MKTKKNRAIKVFLLASLCMLLFPFTAVGDVNNPLTGTYYGTATITSPASLGTIDLAFYLHVTGSAIQHDTSYIVLEKTLLFPAVSPQIGGKDVGPRVNGTVSPVSFSLSTDKFNSSVTGKSNPVERKIVLSNTTVTNAGNSISGDFTEIISGMDKDVISVKGTFLLVKPTTTVMSTSIKDMNNDNCIDLDEIKAGGNDANVVEYGDISYALHIYNDQSSVFKICNPKSIPADSSGEKTIKDSLTDYYNSQK